MNQDNTCKNKISAIQKAQGSGEPGNSESFGIEKGPFMTKVMIAGILSLIFAAMIFGYQAISSVMGPKASYKTILLVDVLDKGIVAWIDGITSDTLFKIMDYIITTPLSILFAIIGGILLIISSSKVAIENVCRCQAFSMAVTRMPSSAIFHLMLN